MKTEPQVLQSAKQTQFHGFSPDLYKTFNPHPPNLPSNTRDSHFGIGNPLFKKFQVNTSHKANFTGPPDDFKKVSIDPNVKDRLSMAHWEIGTPSTGPVLNTTAVLSFQQRNNSYQGQNKAESIKNIQMMRGHHYNLGDQKLNYETTANRKEHANRTMEPSMISPER